MNEADRRLRNPGYARPIIESIRRSPRMTVGFGAVAVSATAIFVDLSRAQPGTASFYRCVLALPLLLPLAVAEGRGTRRMTGQEVTVAVIAGVLFAADMLLWTQAIFDVGAGISTLIVNVQVLIVPLLAFLVDGESISGLFLAMLPVMGFGVVLAGGVIDHGAEGSHPLRGTLEAVLAALSYSGFLFILRRSGKRTPVLQSYARS
jgi:drug/metabolite transporter (DMT)-like permease